MIDPRPSPAVKGVIHVWYKYCTGAAFGDWVDKPAYVWLPFMGGFSRDLFTIHRGRQCCDASLCSSGAPRRTLEFEEWRSGGALSADSHKLYGYRPTVLCPSGLLDPTRHVQPLIIANKIRTSVLLRITVQLYKCTAVQYLSGTMILVTEAFFIYISRIYQGTFPIQVLE